MITENVMKLGNIEKLRFLLFFPSYKSETLILDDLADVSHHKKKKKKIIKNQFELNSEKCIKMHMSGPKIRIELSVISR